MVALGLPYNWLISDERVIHLDQYSGAVLYDAGLADLGPLGRLAEWGVSVHMGQEFGLANQLVEMVGKGGDAFGVAKGKVISPQVEHRKQGAKDGDRA